MIVPATGFSDALEKHIKREFRERLGDNVDVLVELVDEIRPDRSGKFRYVVSRVGRSSDASNSGPGRYGEGAGNS